MHLSLFGRGRSGSSPVNGRRDGDGPALDEFGFEIEGGHSTLIHRRRIMKQWKMLLADWDRKWENDDDDTKEMRIRRKVCGLANDESICSAWRPLRRGEASNPMHSCDSSIGT